jgi:hypothetical protein
MIGSGIGRLNTDLFGAPMGTYHPHQGRPQYPVGPDVNPDVSMDESMDKVISFIGIA